MAFFDTYPNLQFLDLDGVDDDEKKWILMSLQSWDPCVEGPWEFFDVPDDQQNPTAECSVQTDMNNGMAQMPFEQYHSSVLISNHVSPISPQVYPQTYQIYQPAFVPQFSGTMLPVVSGAMMPVNTPMVPVAIPSNSASGYVQPVTYSTYVPAVQANPIYMISPPVVKDVPMHPSQHPHSDQLPNQQMHPEVNFNAAYSPPMPIVSATISPQSGSDCLKLVELVSHAISEKPDEVSSISTSQTTVELERTNGHECFQINGVANDPGSPSKVEVPNDVAATTNAVSGTETVSMNWAGLFKPTDGGANTKRARTNKPPIEKVSATASLNDNHKVITERNVVKSSSKSFLAEIGDPNYFRMGEILVDYSPDSKTTSLQPRGLINRSNYCYINSILQAMLACPPMYNLLTALGSNIVTKEHRKYTQVIDNMVKFVKEFNCLPASQRVHRRSDKVQKKDISVAINCDRPFEPNWIYKILNGMRSDSFVVEGRQEDAEEFLGCLLNGLNDEMLELMKLVGNNGKKAEAIVEDGYKSDCDPEWQVVVGSKNKGAITHRTEVVRTPISDIFGGHIQTKLHRAGDRSSNNIQPFFTLQLNIEKVNTVGEALEALVCKNQLEGVTSSKTNEEVEAWQQVTIEELPVVLILHLKCFDFKLDGCTKIIKQLEFPVDLKIDSKLLSKANYQAKEKQYKLFAVVYHDGKEATKGHYLTDAYHVGYASWLRYDDASVKPVSEEQVLKPHGNRVPYLLFYRRCDTVRIK